MAVKIRKAFTIMPDSLYDDQRYIFHGIDRAEAEEICLAFVEELLDDDIQMMLKNDLIKYTYEELLQVKVELEDLYWDMTCEGA